MITILIFIVISIIFRFNQDWRTIDNVGDFILASVLGGAIGFFFGLIIACALPMNTEVNLYEYNIEALQDNNGIEGSFFLGSGHFEGKMAYVFYYQIDGGFKMKQVDADHTIIKYSNDKKVIVHKWEATDNWVNWFAIDFPDDSDYEVFVPNGTIKNNFTLDAN